MKFFIDTANLDEIREAKEIGIIDGVTTNPSLVAKEGCKTREDFKKLIHEICYGCQTEDQGGKEAGELVGKEQ